MTKPSTAVVSSFIPNPENSVFSLKLRLFVKNGWRHAWTDPKDLMALSNPWCFPSAALPGALSITHRITESQNSRGWKGPLWVI